MFSKGINRGYFRLCGPQLKMKLDTVTLWGGDWVAKKNMSMSFGNSLHGRETISLTMPRYRAHTNHHSVRKGAENINNERGKV